MREGRDDEGMRTGQRLSLQVRPTAYDLLPTTCDLLPTTYHLRPTTYLLLPTTCYLRPTTYHLLPTTYCLRPTTYYLPSTNGHLLLTDLLPTTYLLANVLTTFHQRSTTTSENRPLTTHPLVYALPNNNNLKHHLLNNCRSTLYLIIFRLVEGNRDRGPCWNPSRSRLGEVPNNELMCSLAPDAPFFSMERHRIQDKRNFQPIAGIKNTYQNHATYVT